LQLLHQSSQNGKKREGRYRLRLASSEQVVRKGEEHFPTPDLPSGRGGTFKKIAPRFSEGKGVTFARKEGHSTGGENASTVNRRGGKEGGADAEGVVIFRLCGWKGRRRLGGEERGKCEVHKR